MSGLVVFSLTLQALAAGMVIRHTRGHLLTNVGTLFVLVAVAYHGLTEVVQMLFPGRNARYRSLVAPWELPRWAALAGMAILLLTVAYLLVRGPIPAPDPARTKQLRDGLPGWPVWAVLAGPLLVLAIRAEVRHRTDAVAGLANQFAVPFVVLATVAFVVRHPRARIAALSVEALLLLAGGSRLEVIAALVATLGAVQMVQGRTISRRVVTMGGLAGFAGLVLLSSARAHVGRAVFAAMGPRERIGAILGAWRHLSLDQMLNDTVYRFDGNIFPALVLTGLDRGDGPTGITPFLNAVWLAVPSFLNPGKLGTDLATRSEEVYMARHFGFPDALDYLPMTLGPLLAYAGPLGLLGLAVIAGTLLGLVDRWLHRSAGVLTIPVYVTVATAAIMQEKGMPGWTLSLRGLAVVAVVLLVWGTIAYNRRLHRDHHSRSAFDRNSALRS